MDCVNTNLQQIRLVLEQKFWMTIEIMNDKLKVFIFSYIFNTI